MTRRRANGLSCRQDERAGPPPRRRPAARRRAACPALLALTLLGLPAAAHGASQRLDPERTVGPEACAKCHDREYRVWQETAHARIFASLHQRPRAQEIARKLDIHLVRHDSLCLNCHYTPRLLSGKVTARAGVSCESCHGPARDWLTVHNTFEGRQVQRRAETPDQRRRRQDRNAEAGMRAGGRLYDLVSRCYSCHLVPEERLVDAGGHNPGGSFDLAERFDRIRHNFVTGGRTANAPLTAERRRQLYVLGLALELEHALRGLAEARAAGGYADSRVRRVEAVKKRIRKVQKAVAVPQLAAALAAADGLRLEAGNAAEVGHAVARVAAAARGFAEQENGSRLAALDALWAAAAEPAAGGAGADGVLGEELAAGGGEGETGALPGGEAPAGETTAGGGVAGAPAGRPGSGAVRTGGTGGTGGAAPARAVGAGAGPQGALRKALRAPLGNARVVGQGQCDSCHVRENGWWYKDRHAKSADPFLRALPRARQIARVYYGRSVDAALATGQVVCMDCHATVPTGQRAQEVEAGVSCESCHGPAGGYREQHDEKRSRGERLALGIVDLENLDRRAEVCASCHYVNDERLLASGHSAGESFDVAARMQKIVHWSGGAPEAGRMRAAYQKAMAARGPLPRVQVVRAPAAPALPPASPAAGSGAGGGPRRGPFAPAGASAPAGTRGPGRAPALGAGQAGRPARVPLPRPQVAAGRPGAAAPAAHPAALPAALPPLPAGLARRPLAEVLAAVQQRLDALYRALEGEPR